jgi:hypothetical protein
MVNRRHVALQGVDPDRRRRERKNNIVNARANAREERLNHRRRLDADPTQEAQLATESNVPGGQLRGLEELQTNVRFGLCTPAAVTLLRCCTGCMSLLRPEDHTHAAVNSRAQATSELLPS